MDDISCGLAATVLECQAYGMEPARSVTNYSPSTGFRTVSPCSSIACGCCAQYLIYWCLHLFLNCFMPLTSRICFLLLRFISNSVFFQAQHSLSVLHSEMDISPDILSKWMFIAISDSFENLDVWARYFLRLPFYTHTCIFIHVAYSLCLTVHCILYLFKVHC